MFTYGTDAPIYHWPLTTVAMIVVNVYVFATMFSDPEAPWIMDCVLSHGHGLHPLQWLTSNFMHASIEHLVGNMFALWTFGLIVEGKLGWWKTLAAYLGIGVAQNAMEQLLMLGSDGPGSLGASSIIYGFMAMSLIWAPANNIYCVYLLLWRAWFFEMSVMTMAVVMIGLQVLIVVATGGAMSSAFLHVMGIALGFPLGIVLLKTKVVDGEGWDAFSMLAGRHGRSAREREIEETKTPEFRQRMAERAQIQRATAWAQFRAAMHADAPQAALALHKRAAAEFHDWRLSEDDVLALIRALHRKELWSESMPLMVEYLGQFSKMAAPMRLKLAQILLTVEHRPAQAQRVLSKIDEAALDPKHRAVLEKLWARAEQLSEEETYEIVEEW